MQRPRRRISYLVSRISNGVPSPSAGVAIGGRRNTLVLCRHAAGPERQMPRARPLRACGSEGATTETLSLKIRHRRDTEKDSRTGAYSGCFVLPTMRRTCYKSLLMKDLYCAQRRRYAERMQTRRIVFSASLRATLLVPAEGRAGKSARLRRMLLHLRLRPVFSSPEEEP